ncbi:DUF6091 family protein [Acinetobacter modestus]|uniref:putative solute-binding protein n=1 Tax=Acinetobacter modestus TaxID=1776740 RepID=UPI00202F8F5C|nr:putative solute-binding protein [Acinetobacter modestus]MCM1958749.1 DUF6091 family protein [Acinetobacter modestus]
MIIKKSLIGLALFGCAISTQAKQTVCVFDPVGKSGDAFALAKDYALEAKKWGADIDLRAYVDERVAAEDLKVGQCDGAIISGLRGRQFNKYVGSLDAIAKAAGKKVGVFAYDEAQPKLVAQVGAQAVSVDVTNAGAKFNNHQIDIVPAPIVAYKPFELYKGLGDKGGIVKFPLTQISANFIIRKDKFPEGFGQKSREWVAGQLGRTFNIIAKYEKEIPEKYWMNIPPEEQLNYMKMMREARISLTKAGIYDPKMMNFLKKVRCKQNPNSFECALNDE